MTTGTLPVTLEQKRKLVAGEPIPIVGDGDCPVSVGDAFELASGVRLTIARVDGRRGGGWALRYEIHRQEPIRLLRRTPPTVVPRGEFDEPTAEALQRATRESNYTTSPALAVVGADEAPPESVVDGYTKEARERDARRKAAAQRNVRDLGLERRLARVKRLADEKGVDLTGHMAAIERRLTSAERKVA